MAYLGLEKAQRQSKTVAAQPSFYYTQGNAFLGLGELTAAMERGYEKALEVDGTHSGALRESAIVLRKRAMRRLLGAEGGVQDRDSAYHAGRTGQAPGVTGKVWRQIGVQHGGERQVAFDRLRQCATGNSPTADCLHDYGMMVLDAVLDPALFGVKVRKEKGQGRKESKSDKDAGSGELSIQDAVKALTKAHEAAPSDGAIALHLAISSKIAHESGKDSKATERGGRKKGGLGQKKKAPSSPSALSVSDIAVEAAAHLDERAFNGRPPKFALPSPAEALYQETFPVKEPLKLFLENTPPALFTEHLSLNTPYCQSSAYS